MNQPTTAMIALSALAMASLSGCASIEPPRQELVEARTRLNAAQQQNADEYAALAVKRAQDNITEAERLMNEEHYLAAKRLAEQAIADARLAEVTANSETLKAALNEIETSLDTLKQELNIQS